MFSLVLICSYLIPFVPTSIYIYCNWFRIFRGFRSICSSWKGELLSGQSGSKLQMDSSGGGPCWRPLDQPASRGQPPPPLTKFYQDPPELFVRWVSLFCFWPTPPSLLVTRASRVGPVSCFVHVVLFHYFLCLFLWVSYFGCQSSPMFSN